MILRGQLSPRGEVIAIRMVRRHRQGVPVCVHCIGLGHGPNFRRETLCEPCSGTGLGLELGGEA